ncbi:MAG: hypothetical protein ACHQD8_03435 [Chitinophagales bacterium]
MKQGATLFYNRTFSQQNKPFNTGLLFCFLWVLMFTLYFPAAKAGFVTDFTGWLDQVKNHSFSEYINRTNFKTRSLYQFTQLATYLCYKLFGINAWLWHLLFITLHTINATLIYQFTRRLLDDTGVDNSATISFTGVLLFCVSPYISEVIVWEPAFHYLQGLLLIMVIMVWVQRFVHTGAKKYVWWACILYFLSLFSLEVFYITPWLVLTLGLFYRYNTSSGKKIFYKVVAYFFIPMLLLFFMRMGAYRLAYGDWVSRIGSDTVAKVQIESFGKPVKYLFHLLFLGRFFPNGVKENVYAFCDSVRCIVVFYSIIALICAYIVARFRVMGGKAKVLSLLFTWTLITLALLIPLWFNNMLLVIQDRYTYFTSPFLYMLPAILVSFISLQYLRIGIIAVYVLINLRFAIKVNRYWGKSYRVNHGLLYNLPDPGNKIVILLNLPESMNGIPMIGAGRESEYTQMHNLLLPGKKISNTLDVLSYNMLTPDDGAHATVINDSMVKVTLNQWGTWWWYEGKGGYSYENSDYKLNVIDPGHFYELTLKKPAQQYLLLYEVGDQWKVVDMNKKNADQN